MKNVKRSKHNKGLFHGHRRGIIDVQFNWIFVLVAGMIIFLFIISIAFSQKRSADNQASISTLNQVVTLLKGRQQTAEMYSEIMLPRTDILFVCDPNAPEYFNFKVGNSRTQLPVEIIFAPQQINTNKLIIWSQAFTAGFPVGVFSYVTTEDSVILIYNTTEESSTYAKELFTDLNSVGNVTHKYISNIDEYKKFSRRTIICFDGDCPASSSDYIKITPVIGYGGLFRYGNVTFHKKKPSDSTYPYITKAGLYGAIFSDSSEYYSCQMSRALTQFEVKRSLIDSRLKLMQSALPEGECKTTLKIVSDIEMVSISEPKLNWEDITNMYKQSENLETRNRYLELNSCPKIY